MCSSDLAERFILIVRERDSFSENRVERAKKKRISQMIKLVVITLLLAECFVVAKDMNQTAPVARVCRVLPCGKENVWRWSIGSVVAANLCNTSALSNILGRLNLHHGDVVLIQRPPQLTIGQFVEQVDWINNWLNSNKVAIYYEFASENVDIFSTPIYHWIAPFNVPTRLGKSYYFFEGRFIGSGKMGFERMVKKIGRAKLKSVYVLGSQYNMAAGIGPYTTPYEEYNKVLRDTLTKNGTELVLPFQVP